MQNRTNHSQGHLDFLLVGNFGACKMFIVFTGVKLRFLVGKYSHAGQISLSICLIWQFIN